MSDPFDKPLSRVPRAVPAEIKGDLRPPIYHLRREMGHSQRSMAETIGIEQRRYYRYDLPVTHESYCVLPVHLGRRFLAVLEEFGIEGVTLDDLYHSFLK